MANKVVMERTLGLFKQSFNGLIRRSYSASAAAPPAASSSSNITAATVSSKKPKHKKKKNLFEVAQFLPNWGVGYQMAKTHWAGISYQITKINLYKDGRHGKAWGIVHKEGLPAADARSQENKWGSQALLEVYPTRKNKNRGCGKSRSSSGLILSYL